MMKKIVSAAVALVLVLSICLTASAQAIYRKGNKGSGVLRIQRYLNTLGAEYGNLVEDGVYGTATVQAVKLFQARHNLKVDGICGPITLNKMGISGDNNPKPSVDDDGDDDSIIEYGSTGSQVRRVQSRLRDLGYPAGRVDGTYGSKTQTAVRYFQGLNGLTIDGKVGQKTYDKLFASDAVPYDKKVEETEYTVLKVGSQDTTANKNAVTRLQKRLVQLHYLSSASITGYYSTTTARAVRLFQERNGLRQDGVAGVKTQSKLYSGSAVYADSDDEIDDGLEPEDEDDGDPEDENDPDDEDEDDTATDTDLD